MTYLMIQQRKKFIDAGNHEYEKTDSIKKEFIVPGNHEHKRTDSIKEEMTV